MREGQQAPEPAHLCTVPGFLLELADRSDLSCLTCIREVGPEACCRNYWISPITSLCDLPFCRHTALLAVFPHPQAGGVEKSPRGATGSGRDGVRALGGSCRCVESGGGISRRSARSAPASMSPAGSSIVHVPTGGLNCLTSIVLGSLVPSRSTAKTATAAVKAHQMNS